MTDKKTHKIHIPFLALKGIKRVGENNINSKDKVPIQEVFKTTKTQLSIKLKPCYEELLDMLRKACPMELPPSRSDFVEFIMISLVLKAVKPQANLDGKSITTYALEKAGIPLSEHMARISSTKNYFESTGELPFQIVCPEKILKINGAKKDKSTPKNPLS